jgi:hypothetical protein
MSSYQDRRSLMHGNSLSSLTVTGGNETIKDVAPSGLAIPLLQNKSLTGNYAPAEVWVPVGLWYIITTGITVNATVLTLRKNGVSAATGGTATLPVHALGADYLFAPITSYTFAAADAAGDQWSLLVTTTSTAGVINPVILCYAIRAVPNVTEVSL